MSLADRMSNRFEMLLEMRNFELSETFKGRVKVRGDNLGLGWSIWINLIFIILKCI
jgi:hypothetical protein